MRVLTLVKTRSGHTTNYWVRYALECPPLPKTLFPFLALLRANCYALLAIPKNPYGVWSFWTVLKPQVCLFVRNVSCGLLAAPKNILCKFANGKLGRTVNKITSVNPNFSVRLPHAAVIRPLRRGIIRWNKKRTEIVSVCCICCDFS